MLLRILHRTGWSKMKWKAKQIEIEPSRDVSKSSLIVFFREKKEEKNLPDELSTHRFFPPELTLLSLSNASLSVDWLLI